MTLIGHGCGKPVCHCDRGKSEVGRLLDRIAELEQALTQVNGYRKDDQARCFRLVARAEAWKRAALAYDDYDDMVEMNAHRTLPGNIAHTKALEAHDEALALDPAEPEEK